MQLNGRANPRFERVREVFEESIEAGEDLGGGVAVTVEGELVVNLSGGWQDRKKTEDWTPETIVTIYSSGKAVVALLIAREVSAGRLDYDAPVASYWPEFAAEGKSGITLAQALSHQSGIPGFAEEMDPALWLDWDGLCAKIAAAKPMWEPGTANGYHPQTVGFTAGEVLRRVTGRTVGQILREDFADPHGIRVFCGLSDEEIALASHMTKPTSAPVLGEMNEYKKAAFLTRWAAPGGVSREDWAKAEMPASNMHADAASLARLMSTFAMKGEFEGEQLFSEDVFDQAVKPRISGDDLVLPFDLTWAAGLMCNTQGAYGPEQSARGHYGFGGSCVFADPVNRVSFAYVPNKMSPHLVADPRAISLINALYESL